jgi:hypothetical protein
MFIPSKQRKIAMVDDYQSIFDMSKIITDVNTGSTPSINPAGNQDIN